MSQRGLKMYDADLPEVAVVKAWSVTGKERRYHRDMQQQVRNRMPLLARALDRMALAASAEEFIETVPLPLGLCGNRTDHRPHEVHSPTLGTYWCHADQRRRLPYYLERNTNAE